MFNSIIEMVHDLQNHPRVQTPQVLSDEEFAFRLMAFEEEINEYSEARAKGNLEGQLDALVDLVVFAMGAAAVQGFDFTEAFHRVMDANLAKRQGMTKRNYSKDLVKPAYWRPPYMGDLLGNKTKQKGIIILDGPDGCGKTTLAEFLQKEYGAYYMHSTWSPELEPDMEEYMRLTTQMAKRISQNQLVVLDRHWLSELVYSDVFREGANRVSMYYREHTGLIGGTNIPNRLVVCCPEREVAKQHFDVLKDTREEMYSNVDKIVDAYLALWYGDKYYVFKNKNKYIQSINLEQGLQNMENTVRYDWTQDGKNMREFCENKLFN